MAGGLGAEIAEVADDLAAHLFVDVIAGFLKAGAQADFVVLSDDPTAVEPMAIRDIRVLKTIKNDEVIYSAE